MNNRKMVRLIAVILAVILAGSLIISAVSYIALGASAESELEQLEQDAEDLKDKEAEAEARITALEYEQISVLEKKQVLDNQVVITEEKVNILEQQLDACLRAQSEISDAIEEAERTEASQRELYGRRVCSTEENGIISYFSVLFNADSFFDLLSRLDFFRQMMQYDDQVYTDYIKSKIDTAQEKKRLEDMQQKEQEIKAAISKADDELLTEASYAADVFSEDTQNESGYVEMCDQIEELQSDFEKQITDNLADVVHSSQAGIAVGTGTFISPVSGTITVTEEYGSLLNEKFLYYRMHRGVDLAAQYGTDVMAADRGTIVLTGYTISYGNYIVITHGNEYVTVYAHLGDVNVSAGEVVEQGQVIGSVGSTGAAASACVHFEIRYENQTVNPLRFLSSSTDGTLNDSVEDETE